MILLSANNASATLAAGIGSGTTTILLATGTGALFPNPGANEYFTLTLNDVATGNVYEVCNCTARTGDSLTVVRGVDGTTAQAWVLGDFAYNTETANSIGAARAFAATNAPTLPFTIPPEHRGVTQYCGTAGTITLPAVGGIQDGYLCPIVCTSSGATITINTNSATVALPSGNVTSAFTIAGLQSGVILQWSAALTKWLSVGVLNSLVVGGGLTGTLPNPGLAAFTSTNASPGLVKLPGGITIQWFATAVPCGGGLQSTIVPFPVAFFTATLALMICFDGTTPPAPSNPGSISVDNNGNVSCQVTTDYAGASTLGVQIWAIGI